MGIFFNKQHEEAEREGKYRSKKLSKYQQELKKQKGEMNQFDLLNNEINLTTKQYKAILEFKPAV